MNSIIRLVTSGAFATAIVVAISAASPANAIPFVSNYTYGGGSTQNYMPNGPGTLIDQATSVTEGSNQKILVENGPAGAVGDVLTYLNNTFSVPAGNAGALGALTVDWSTYSFTSAGGLYSRNANLHDLNFLWIGNFHDTSGVLSNQSASFSQTWSQASPGILPNAGGTFSSPNAFAVAEPGTLALLATSVLGLGLIARRRTNAVSKTA